MNLINTFLIGYILGGLTLFPFLLAIYVYLPNISLHNIPLLKQIKKKITSSSSISSNEKDQIKEKNTLNSTTNTNTNTTAINTTTITNTNITTAAATATGPGSALYKIGWLRMTHGSPPVISLKKPDQRLYFTVLKQHTLFLYDSEEQLDCQLVLSLNDYKVGVYPEDILDPELFSRPYWIQLKPLIINPSEKENHHQQQPIYYFHCHVCTEKEDWFHILLQASGKPRLPQPMSLEPLIQVIHSNSHHLEVQWFNALLSRLFMGIHLTKKFHQSIEKKIMTKVDKINARKPPFLGDIQVRKIDIGKQNGSIPFITQPKLLSLSTQGECWLEAMMDYHGNNCTIEIATVLQWSYSDRLPPLTMDIVLSVSLQSIQGKFKLLIKPPPSNRLWYGFEGLPKMKWNIVPLVWEKKIGHSMVVKAIIKHLEEVFSDTMVLPHMDDTTFFDNGGSGGIYQDDMILHENINENNNNENNNSENNNNNNNNNENISDSDTVIEDNNHQTSIDQPYFLKKSFSSSTTNMKFYHQHKNNKNKNKNGSLYISPTSLSLPHLAMDTQKTSSLTTESASSASLPIPNNNNNNTIVKKSSTEPIPIQKENKKNKDLSTIDQQHQQDNNNGKKKKPNNKKEQKKIKQQDMKLLSTVKSLPELISAHTNQHPSPHKQLQQQNENEDYFLLSTSPSHPSINHNDTSSLFSNSLSPPKFDDSHKHHQQQSSSTTTTTTTTTTTAKPLPIFLSNSSSTTTTNTSSTAGSSSDSSITFSPTTTSDVDHHHHQNKDDLSTSPNAPLLPPKLPPIPADDNNDENNNNNNNEDDQRPLLKPRKSLSHLTQKTTASTPITQVTPAAGVFLAKNLPH